MFAQADFPIDLLQTVCQFLPWNNFTQFNEKRSIGNQINTYMSFCFSSVSKSSSLNLSITKLSYSEEESISISVIYALFPSHRNKEKKK
jgi:hypothetical protein